MAFYIKTLVFDTLAPVAQWLPSIAATASVTMVGIGTCLLVQAAYASDDKLTQATELRRVDVTAGHYNISTSSATSTTPELATPIVASSSTKKNSVDSLSRRINLVELPAEFNPTGRQRSHHAIGIRSFAAENWLKDHGVAANNCFFPMLRMHTRLAPSGSASGALWVYARCGLP